MFKSRIPRQISFGSKIWLPIAILLFFGGWSSSQAVSSPETKLAASSPSDRQLTRQLTELARLTHQKVNQYRAAQNLAPLKFNALISKQAKIHSENMAQQTVDFSHEGFQGRIKALQDNISYSGAAENIAYNMGYEDPVNRAVAGWIESDGHRQNMIRNYDLTGIGVAVNQEGEYYFTQIFIREN